MEDMERGHTPLREISNTPNRESSQGSHSKPSTDEQQRYTLLMKQARKAAEEGHPRESLQCLIKASKICKTEKVLKRIARIEEYLKENGSESESDEDTGMHHAGKGFYVQTELYSKLYSYQRESLMWFWRLHRKNKGGILGDDMGLGKTIQVISFLSGLYHLGQVKTVLIVLPVALIINWEKEFDKWAPGIFVESHHSSSKRERERALAKVQRRGGVLLTSYGLVLTNHELLSHRHENPFTWDYVILDEGHKIKNPSKTTKAIHKVPATHRIILTGTPIQNNLKELWALFDFVTQSTLLGTAQTFNSEYANPITRAREKDATGGERLLGNQMAESLRELIAPYFLRRTKADVVKRRNERSQNQEGEDEADKENDESVPEFPTLTRKNDFVIWLHLTEAQIKIYRDFLSLDQVKELLMTTRSPLVELTILKKLCDHPRLLPVRACIQLGLETADDAWADDDENYLPPPSSKNQANNQAIQAITDEILMMESCKLQFLVNLLTNLKREGHRTLVFSQSRKMLDIIEKVLTNQNFEVMRLDGTITKLEDREKRISSFQHNTKLSVFLLTTQVGGVGLTLTGADRVVVFDPSWNPATDSQAVDRAYRIGQTRSVVIYRLITCGSVEEKIYRRQIFKDSLTKQATGTSKNPYRYFSRGELKDLFILDNPQTSTTQLALQEMHAAQRKSDTQLDEHIAFLYSLDIFGLTDHDLMFSQEADTENKEEQEQAAEYIQHRVSRAKELVSAESDLTQKLKENIDQGTEGPGSMQRHHRQYGDRQTLLNHAAELGEQVNVPAFNKRRDDYDRKNRSPSESEEEEEEQEEDLNMSMANMTLEERDIAVHPQVTKGHPTVNLLADRPPSSHAAQGTSVICIEDSDDEDEIQLSTSVARRNESDLDIIEDSDTEVMTSPKVISSERSKSSTARSETPNVSFSLHQAEETKVGVKNEQDRVVLDDKDGVAQDFCITTEEDDELMESQKVRLKHIATTPKESLCKRSRFSKTPQNKEKSPGFHGNSSYEGDDCQEVPPTPMSVIDLADEDESEANLSNSFEEIEQRTIATSPLAASPQSLSPDSPPRPISMATDAGVLEQNVDSDYYMESDEDEEVRPTYSGLIPASDHKTSKSYKSPDHRHDSSLEESYESPDIEQRSVALSPMIHDDTVSESSPENTPHLQTSQQQSAKEEDAFQSGKEVVDESLTSSEKSFRYNSDADSHGPGNSTSIQGSMDVTRQLVFDDTKFSKRNSDAATPDKTEDSDQIISGELNKEEDLEDDNEGIDEQPDEDDDKEETKMISGLEHTMSFMSMGSGEEHSRDDDQDDAEQNDFQADSQDESEEDVIVSTTRRRQVIKDSDEEHDDSSLLEQSSATDEENEDSHSQPQDEDEDEIDDDDDDKEDVKMTRGADVQGDLDKDEEEDEEEEDDDKEDDDKEDDDKEDEDEEEDSFIDDEECIDDESSGSDEEYENSDEDDEADGEEDVLLTEEQQQKYQDLVAKGRIHQSKGNIKKALACYLTALDIDDSDKELQQRAYRLAQQYKKQDSHS